MIFKCLILSIMYVYAYKRIRMNKTTKSVTWKNSFYFHFALSSIFFHHANNELSSFSMDWFSFYMEFSNIHAYYRTSLIQHKHLDLHQFKCIFQQFIPFYCWIVFHCMTVPPVTDLVLFWLMIRKLWII